TILLLIFSVLCIVQVVMRYIFNESLTWSEELSRYAFVWFVYTSAAYAVRYQRHVKFSFLIHFSENITPILSGLLKITALRSEERRVGKECRFCWWRYHLCM